MKRKVWFEVFAGVGFRAVVLKRIGFLNKIIYRDCWGKCNISYETDLSLIERE